MDDAMLGAVAIALQDTAFSNPRTWANAVVILRHEEPPRATSRGDFAGWLASNGLASSARECTRRRVPPGHILVWLEIDVEAVSAARFNVYNFDAALHAARRSA